MKTISYLNKKFFATVSPMFLKKNFALVIYSSIIPLHDFWVNFDRDPRALRSFGNFISNIHRLGGFASVFDSFPSQHDLPHQKARPDNGDPNTPLCPKCAIFGSLSSSPLGAKVAFVFPIRSIAWGFVLFGFGEIGPRRDLRIRYVFVGIAILLMPLFIGIV